MGEGKIKARRVIDDQPTCTYCGGEAASSSIDHCPPITIFDHRWRPKGMEFGACDPCHQGTREMDAVAGFVSRIYGSGSTESLQIETRRAIRSMFLRYSHILERLHISNALINYRGAPGYVTNIEGNNALHLVMEGFAARMGLALYRQELGKPAPKDARIICRWQTNLDMDEDEALDRLLRAKGLPNTLIQGKKNVADQFRYWAGRDGSDANVFGCVAVFRESFGITTFVDTRDDSDMQPHFQPGFLQGFKV